MDGPEEAHLVAGAVEEVVAAVQQDGSEEPGEGAGPGHGLTDVNLALAGLPHLDQHRALFGDVLTHVEETLDSRVHRNLMNRKFNSYEMI